MSASGVLQYNYVASPYGRGLPAFGGRGGQNAKDRDDIWRDCYWSGENACQLIILHICGGGGTLVDVPGALSAGGGAALARCNPTFLPTSTFWFPFPDLAPLKSSHV